jgi:hypothetical protein
MSSFWEELFWEELYRRESSNAAGSSQLKEAALYVKVKYE